MNLANVKLVVSDMDGTLLNYKGEVSSLFFTLFKQLKNLNITFCAASGRQYNSIVDKLANIKNDIYIIAENGGMVKYKDDIILLNMLESHKIITIIPILRKIKGTNIVLCSQNSAFIESTDHTFISMFQEYYNNFLIVDDLIETAKKTPILKIAVYHYDSSEKYIYPQIKHLKDDYLLKISGKNWLDISSEKANKGYALKKVQEILNVSKKETMVFGDFHNDIEMMQEATFSFAMKNAHKDITKIANYATESNDNFGVETILEQLITSKK